MEVYLLRNLIDRADALIAAIEGTTDQFEPEVQALCAAMNAAEKQLPDLATKTDGAQQ